MSLVPIKSYTLFIINKNNSSVFIYLLTLSWGILYAFLLKSLCFSSFLLFSTFSVRCIKGEPAIEEYYETAKEADKHRDHISEMVVQSHQAQNYLSPGRVVVIKSESVSTTFFLIHHHILIDLQLDEPIILHDKYMNFLHSQTRKDYLFVPFWYHDLDLQSCGCLNEHLPTCKGL